MTLILRNAKGAALTHAELDGNFSHFAALVTNLQAQFSGGGSTPPPPGTPPAAADISATYASKITAVGGSFTSAEQSDLTTFITNNRAWYDAQREIWPFKGGNAASHAIGLKNTHNLIFEGGWVHSSAGSKADGSTGYARTGLIPATELALNSMAWSFYVRNNSTTSVDIFGATTAANAMLRLLPGNDGGTTSLGELGSVEQRALGSVTGQVGLHSIVRSTTNRLDIYRNEVSVANNINTQTGALPGVEVYLNALNVRDAALPQGPKNFSNYELAFTAVGSGYSATDQTAFSAALQALQTAWGRAVSS